MSRVDSIRTGLLLTGTLLVLALAGCSAEPGDGGGSAASSEATAAEAAPDFTLPDLQGNPVRLADFRGKTVIIDFWATWCPPCEFQVPELNALQEAHAAAGDVVVLGVAVDVEGVDVVAPWCDEKGVEYTMLIGDDDLARDFGAMGFPTLVVVRPDGTIDSRHVGVVEVDELEAIVAAIQAIVST
jgi:thiol-disulfide isomerase/thioredoxin